MKRQRRGQFREVLEDVLARNTAFSGGVQDAVVRGWVTGSHSLLRICVYVLFFAESGQPADADFVGCTFSLYGWMVDPEGRRTRVSARAINRDGDMQIPEGWEGSATLDEIEAVVTLADLGAKNGEWRLVAVVEPADGACCSVFDELVSKVHVRSSGAPPTLGPLS